MSENESPSAGQSKSIGMIIVIVVVLVGALALGLLSNTSDKTNEDAVETSVAQTEQTETETETTADAADAAQSIETAAAADSEASDAEPAAEEATETNGFDVEKAATPRILGNPEAPVEISEHSSFTCGGCRGFHEGNFKLIKRDYIDTGKAYIKYDDFPRNGADIEIGVIARCVPEESFFNFVQLIFETQSEWSKSNGMDEILAYMKQNAQLAGASADQLEACSNSMELKEKLAQRRDKAVEEHNVGSTPTLVLNDTTTISGLAPYDQIKAALDKAIAEAEAAQ